MTMAVLFDLEDTLVQTPWIDYQHVLEFRRRTREKLIQLGIPASTLEGIERATLMRNRAFDYVEQNFSETEAEKFQQEMERFLTRYELDSALKSELFPETTSTLETLKTSSVKLGLVTNTSSKAVKTVFQLHGLERYFNVVITRESVRKLKPDPEGILLAVKRLAADSFFMVGDLSLDALAAKSAGGKSIIVNRNVTGQRDFQADHFVHSLIEVPAIIRKEMRKT